jgi:TonB-dependent receptor
MGMTQAFRSAWLTGASAVALSALLFASPASAQDAPAAAGEAPAATGEAAAPDAPGQAVQDAAADEEAIVVTGFRASLQSALRIKRNENGVVDAISAEDMADFPDLNLAESLQRIPGVAISRRSGEGRQISVRGLGSDYTRVRVNGMEAIATSSGTSNTGGTNRGRGFDFNIFSSDLFSNLVVRKTASAEVPEGALGATVDLNAQRPFDAGNRFVVSAQGSYNDLAKKVTPGVTALFSRKLFDGKLGILVSAAYDERRLIEEGANITRWTYGGSNGGFNAASTVEGVPISRLNHVVTDYPDAQNGIYAPRIPAYVSYDTRSKRLGFSGAIQFRPTNATLLTLEGLYSKFEGVRYEQQLQALGLSRPGSGKPVSIIRSGILDGNNLVQANIDRVDLRTQSSHNELNTTFRQVTASLEQTLTDSLRFKGMAGHSDSKYSDPVATTVTFERIDSNNFTYDFRPRMMEMSLGFDATDPANWAMVPGSSEVRLTPEWVNNDFTTFAGHFEYDFAQGLTLKVGGDYRRFGYDTHALQRTNTADVPAIPAGAGIRDLSFTFNFDRGIGLPDNVLSSWLAPNLPKFAQQYGIYSGTGIWALRENVGTTARIREATKSAFAQLDFKFDALGLAWRGDVGLRYFKTDLSSSGNAVVGAGRQFVTVKNSYDRFLPAANLSVDLTRTLIARISAAETIARAGIGSLSPGGSVTVQGANRNYSSGNPFLEPTQSKNLDFSLEWYPNSSSIVALGLFYKDISTFVQSLVREARYDTLGLPNSLLDGTVATPDMVFNVTQPVNSPGGSLKGFEINVQQRLDFLPGFLSNFGFLANYTYVNSKIDYLTTTNPNGSVIRATLNGLSKQAYNATLYYETKKFSARASVAYRSRYLTAVPGGDFNDVAGTNATTNVDAQVSYNVTDDLRFSLEGLNLTDEKNDAFVDSSNRLNVYTHTGRQFVASVRYSF